MPCAWAPAAPTCCWAATSSSAPAPMRWPARARRRRTPSSTRTRPSPATSRASPTSPSPRNTLRLSIEAAAGAEACDFVEATEIATALMGDSIATNMFMLGYAYQKGLVPLGHEALERAIELNGAAVADEHGGLPLGPPRRRRPRRRRALVAPRRRMSCPSRSSPKTARRDRGVACQASHRLPERGPGRALHGAGRPGARRRAEDGTPGTNGLGRSGRPQLRQAARLQGRVRGRPALHRGRLPGPGSSASSRATTG